MSQVPQVGYRETACGEDVDGVSSPEGATLAVMEGFYGADGKRAGAVKGDGFRLLHGVVVKVAVAAKNLVDLELLLRQGRITLHAGVGVQQNPIAALLHQKTGVAQPGEFHINLLLAGISKNGGGPASAPLLYQIYGCLSSGFFGSSFFRLKKPLSRSWAWRKVSVRWVCFRLETLITASRINARSKSQIQL